MLFILCIALTADARAHLVGFQRRLLVWSNAAFVRVEIFGQNYSNPLSSSL